MDLKKKLVELLENHCAVIGEFNCKASQGEKCTPRDCAICLASGLIDNGVTVQDLDGCEYCKEDNEGYRKMIGAFSITNPFHGNVWNIETCHCKPRQIYFCPMCGRKLGRKENDYEQNSRIF